MNGFATRQELDDLVAEQVMGWTIWSGDWYTRVEVGHKFQSPRIWSPSEDGSASTLVWLRCLEKAREMGYELTQKLDADGRVHVNGDHPVAKRLLVIDMDIHVAICRFALELFGVTPPHPYERNPLKAAR